MRERNRDVEQAAEYLNSIPRFSREKHSMEDLRTMLRLLHAEPEHKKIIHVAGTNGKGSVCAFLSSILRTAGYHTAVFTSPHLLSVKERFSFDGDLVSDSCFLDAYRAVREAVPVFEQAGAGHPTYFEYLFLMFMWMLRQYPVDYVILETGLGGRLDATNCLENPLLSVITSISLDHMEYLGTTMSQIAEEKAGIIKTGVPVLYDDTSAEASAVIKRQAEEKNSVSEAVGRYSYRELMLKDGRMELSVSSPHQKLDGLRLTIPFAAEYQAVNALLAVHAAARLSISPEIIAEGIRNTVWPGRMEETEEGLYIDGAHNEGGIREFARAAGKLAGNKRRLLLFAVVSDKEYQEMLGILCREFKPDLLILTQIQYGRGLDIHRLKAAAQKEWENWMREAGNEKSSRELRMIPTLKEALAELRKEKRSGEPAFCAGSLYLVGELKEIMEEEKQHE